tara:strand:+ start:440 stop:1120 length:681 start_codon:yes stop_codon:yes gene_type:complete
VVVFITTLLKIAGGNSTVLVSGCPEKMKDRLSKKYLEKVEQVGFVSEIGGVPRLNMMGGELCVNATLAFASQLFDKGELVTSGVEGKIKYENKNGVTKISIPLKYRKLKNIILFDGIGFICIDKCRKFRLTKKFLSNFCKRYDLLAFGAIIYDQNRIDPYVYVKEVNSFVRETACGSGSIAYSLFSGYGEIVQPTKKVIEVKRVSDKNIEVISKVCEIKEGLINDS